MIPPERQAILDGLSKMTPDEIAIQLRSLAVYVVSPHARWGQPEELAAFLRHAADVVMALAGRATPVTPSRDTAIDAKLLRRELERIRDMKEIGCHDSDHGWQLLYELEQAALTPRDEDR